MIYKNKVIQFDVDILSQQIIQKRHNNGYKLPGADIKYYIESYVLDEVVRYLYKDFNNTSNEPDDIGYLSCYQMLYNTDIFNIVMFKMQQEKNLKKELTR